MSGKSSRISVLWEGVDPRGRDVRYAAYFHHFNRGDYYESHDVLESLWLEGGRQTKGAAFYQGLIQLAGGFVHLRKHFENPTHQVHGQRLSPAARLFALAEKNIGAYGVRWEGLELDPVLDLAKATREEIEKAGFQKNPWNPGRNPVMTLPGLPGL